MTNDIKPDCELIENKEAKFIVRPFEPYFTFYTNDPESGSSKEVGKLWWLDGKLHFEGNADESAKIFFDSVIQASFGRPE